jgi:hypothetical protein
MSDNLLIIPFCCGLLFFAILFAFLLGWRFLQYQETLALAEKGILKTEAGRVEARGNGKNALRWGVVISALGLALTIGLWPIGFYSNYPFGLSPWMLFGFIPLFFGLGLILIYVLTKENGKPGGSNGNGGSASA